MAIAVDASSPAAVTSTSNTATTASFTPAANSLLVAIVALGNTGAALVSGTVSDSLSSTWNLLRRIRSSATAGTVEIWVQDIGASPSARTVTLTGSVSAASGCTLTVQCLTGARAYNNGNGQCLGQQSQSTSGTGANLSLAALAAGSLTYYVLAYDAAATLTMRADNTSLVNFSDTTNTATFVTSRVTATSTQGSTQAGGTTTTSGLTANSAIQFVVEFVAAAATLKNTRINFTIGATDAALTSTGGDATRLASLTLRSEYQPNTATYFHKRSVAGPTSALQLTDASSTGLTTIADGTPLSFYTLPLKAVTIAGQIVATLFARENTTGNAIAVTCALDRCASDGSYISTIIDQTTTGMAATGGELSTAVGGANKTFTITAANVPDTTLVNGDRLRVRVYFDDAADFGGTGNMAASTFAQFATTPTGVGSAGDSRIVFTENLEEYVLGNTATISAASAGTSSTGASVAVTASASATSDGTSTSTSAAALSVAVAASSDSTSTAVAALRASWALTGASEGTSSVAAAAQATSALAAASAGASTVSAAAAVLGDGSVSATATGASTTSAAVAVTRPLAASSTGTSAAASAAALVAALTATSSSAATTSAAAVRELALTSTSAGTSTSTSAVAIAYAVSAVVAGIADVLAAISAGRRVYAHEPLMTAASGLERRTRGTDTDRVTRVAPTDRETQRA